MRFVTPMIILAGLLVLCIHVRCHAESISILQMNAQEYINSGKLALAEKELLKALELDVLEGSVRLRLAELHAAKGSWGMVGLLLAPLNQPWNSWKFRAKTLLNKAPRNISGYSPVLIPDTVDSLAGGKATQGTQFQQWKKEAKNEFLWFLAFAPQPQEGLLNPSNTPVIGDLMQAVGRETAGGKGDLAALGNAFKKVSVEFAPKLLEFRKTLKFRWHQWTLDGFQAVMAMAGDDDKVLEAILAQWSGTVRKVLFLLWVQEHAMMHAADCLPEPRPLMTYSKGVRQELAGYGEQTPFLRALAKGLSNLEKPPLSEEGMNAEVERLSFEECEKRAASGDMYAQRPLGRLFCKQTDREIDYAKAVEWYSKAAAQGDSFSLYQLGNLCEEGKGSSPDAKNAFVWYFQAAKMGHATAQQKIADMYCHGNGIAQDENEGRAWLVIAHKMVMQISPREFEPLMLKKMTMPQLEKARKRADEIQKELGLSANQ